jgi:hypothetical protein
MVDKEYDTTSTEATDWNDDALMITFLWRILCTKSAAVFYSVPAKRQTKECQQLKCLNRGITGTNNGRITIAIMLDYCRYGRVTVVSRLQYSQLIKDAIQPHKKANQNRQCASRHA